MSSVRSALSYTERAIFNTLFSPRWAPVRIIVGCAPGIGPPALASSSAAPSPSAPSPSALTVSSVSAAVYGSGRGPSEKLHTGIVGAGVLRVLGFVQRRQGAGHQFILIEEVGDVEANYQNCGWNLLT